MMKTQSTIFQSSRQRILTHSLVKYTHVSTGKKNKDFVIFIAKCIKNKILLQNIYLLQSLKILSHLKQNTKTIIDMYVEINHIEFIELTLSILILTL